MNQRQELSVAVGNKEARFVMDDLDGRDHVVAQCLENGLTYYEIPLPSVLMALSQEASGVFLDVGANTGLYSLLCAASNPALYVYSFEPVPAVREIMERNLLANPGIASRIDLSAYALSSEPGRGIIYQHVNPHGLVPTSSSLEGGPSDQISSIEVTIDITTLDIWSNIDASSHDDGRNVDRCVDFMKVDIEGHEKSLFSGALRMISKDRPIIVVELLGNSSFDYFSKFLIEHHYVDIALFPGEARRLHTPRFESGAWNHVLCPVEKAWTFARTCQRIGLPIS